MNIPTFRPAVQREVLMRDTRKILRLVCRKELLVEHERKMLQYCRIAGLIMPVFRFEDGQVIIEYDITDLEQEAERLRSGSKGYRKQLKELIHTLPEYFLDGSGLIVSADNAYYSPESENWQFVFLPLKDKTNCQDLNFYHQLFAENPRQYLQMEMMKDKENLCLLDYINIAT